MMNNLFNVRVRFPPLDKEEFTGDSWVMEPTEIVMSPVFRQFQTWMRTGLSVLMRPDRRYDPCMWRYVVGCGQARSSPPEDRQDSSRYGPQL